MARATAALGSTRRAAVAGWVLYDLAHVVFTMNIISLYFPLWVVDDAGGSDGNYGLASAISMAFVFLAAPFLGALSDQARRRLSFLAVTTVGCCAFTLFLGEGGLVWSLAWFAVANAFFQWGLIFYDALLPPVSTEKYRGWVSGLGIGAGFAGAVLAVSLGLVVLSLDPDGKPLVFKLTAGLFLLAALPCFLWVREPVRANPHPTRRAVVRQTFTEVKGMMQLARSYPGLRRFLIGRVFYTDAGNTALAFMGIYAAEEIGFSDLQTQILLLAGIVAGPKRTLNRLLVLWAVALSLAAFIASANLPPATFWLIAPPVGVAVGGTATTDRPYLMRLAPPHAIGQCYGLNAMVGRFAAITGPLLWALTVDWLGWGRPVAVASLVAMNVVAGVILRPVDDMTTA
ncbi:MAG: MFS transporter [Thermomicrobiales bacterium]